jgi:hypothetical protein
LHDAVQIEAEGTPSTVMITEPFQGLASSFAATLGMPGYHNVTVPHPISSKDEDALRRTAERAVDTIVQQLIRDE